MSDYRQDDYGNYSTRRSGDRPYTSNRGSAGDRYGSDRYGSDRYGSDRSTGDRYATPNRTGLTDRAGRTDRTNRTGLTSRTSQYSRDRYTQSTRDRSAQDQRERYPHSQNDRPSSFGRNADRTTVDRTTVDRTTVDERRGRNGSTQRERALAAQSARSARSSRSAQDPRDSRTSYESRDRNTASRGRSRANIDRVVTQESAQKGRAGRISRNAGNADQGGYTDFSRYLNTPKRSFNPVLIVAPVLAVALIAFGIFQFVNPKTYDITINGAVHTVERGTTIDTVLAAGYAAPIPGDLLAVDGAVLEQGGGDKFSAVVNDGEPTNDGTTPLKKKTVVTISDGADVMEPYAETTEVIPFERIEDENYWNGSLHVYIPGSDGVRATRVGEYSGITITEDTTPVVHNQWKIYNADTQGDKVIALTFDDGPWATTTEAILDILEENNAKATFFTVGNRIADYPSLVKRMHNDGHQVCTHSWDHAAGSGEGVNLTYMSAEEQIEEIEKGIEAIENVLGISASRVIRAPGGNFYGDIIWNLQPHITAEIGWDVDTQDWRRPGADAIAEQILSAQAGDVILMHDGGGDRTQTVEALRIALPKLVEQGYTFVTVDELLAYGIPGAAEAA